MKCFIATSLGYNDVDNIYDNAIKPILKKLGINPIRIDKIEHNDDLDNKIFQLLDDADICIADLTYARPSVYYEAGYAFASGKPVIYIARSDHFRASDKDPHGNLRVHFDLQMKNIIAWTDANKSFKDKLLRRLLHVIKPIVKKENQQTLIDKEEYEFNALSQREKLINITSKARSILRVKHFKVFKLTQNEDYRQFHMIRFQKNIYSHINYHIFPSITKTILRDLRKRPSLYLPVVTAEEQKNAKRYYFSLFLPSLHNVRDSFISDVFPSHRIISKGFYQMDDVLRGQPSTLSVVSIDSIKSISNFASRFKSCLEQTGNY